MLKNLNTGKDYDLLDRLHKFSESLSFIDDIEFKINSTTESEADGTKLKSCIENKYNPTEEELFNFLEGGRDLPILAAEQFAKNLNINDFSIRYFRTYSPISETYRNNSYLLSINAIDDDDLAKKLIITDSAGLKVGIPVDQINSETEGKILAGKLAVKFDKDLYISLEHFFYAYNGINESDFSITNIDANRKLDIFKTALNANYEVVEIVNLETYQSISSYSEILLDDTPSGSTAKIFKGSSACFRQDFILNYVEGNTYIKKTIDTNNSISNYQNKPIKDLISLSSTLAEKTYAKNLLNFRSQNQKSVYNFDNGNGILSDDELNKFLKNIESSKEYFMNTMFNDIFEIYENYKPITELMIAFAAMKKTLNDDFDYLDLNTYSIAHLKNLLASYGLFDIEDIPQAYLLVIAKNIRHFFKIRGTNNLFKDVLKIFEFDGISIEKIFLVKRNKNLTSDERLKKYKIQNEKVLRTKTLPELYTEFNNRNLSTKEISGLLLEQHSIIVSSAIDKVKQSLYTADASMLEQLETVLSTLEINTDTRDRNILNKGKSLLEESLNVKNEFELRKIKVISGRDCNDEILEFLKSFYINARVNELQDMGIDGSMIRQRLVNESAFNTDSLRQLISKKIANSSNTDVLSQIDTIMEPFFSTASIPYPFKEIKEFLLGIFVNGINLFLDKYTNIDDYKLFFQMYINNQEFSTITEQQTYIDADDKVAILRDRVVSYFTEKFKK